MSEQGSQTATFLMHYADTVPAGGSVTYDWSFAQASSSTSLAALEAIERDRFGKPSVFILNPRNHATVTSPTVRVQGRVEDSVGISSLTVAGRGVVVRAGGVFGVTVKLKRGANTIAATARNAAGNAGTSAISVIYKLAPCKVPRLRGMTLSSARQAISRSGCEVGTIKRAHSRSVRKGRVVSSSPSAGHTAPHGTKIALVLSQGK